jgi:hypothetical protein
MVAESQIAKLGTLPRMATAKARARVAPDPYDITHMDIYVSNAAGAKGVSYRFDFVNGRIDLSSMANTKITKETIMTRITSNKICKDQIGQKYMQHELHKSRVILVAYGKHYPMDRPIGFIFAYPTDDKKGIYLSIICAIRVGKHLLNAFFLTAEHAFKYEYIELNALPSVLSYYPQFDFEHKGSCDSEPDVRMTEDLKQKIKSGAIKPNEIMDEIAHVMDTKYELIDGILDDADEHNRNRAKTAKILAKVDKEYKAHLDSMYADNPFLDYIQKLRDEGYVAESSSYTNDSGNDALCIDADELDMYNFIGKGCVGDGFTMRKCFKKIVRNRRNTRKERKQRKSRKHRKSRKAM